MNVRYPVEVVSTYAEILMGAICVSVMEGSSQTVTERHAQVNLLLCVRNVNGYSEWELNHTVSNIFFNYQRMIENSLFFTTNKKNCQPKTFLSRSYLKSYKCRLSKALVMLFFVTIFVKYITLLLSPKCIRKTSRYPIHSR